MVELAIVLSLLELVFGGVAALVAYFAWQRRDRPAGFPVFVLGVAASLYALINGFSTLIPHETTTVFLGHVRFPFGALIAVSTLYIAIEYTNFQRLRRPGILVMFILFLMVDALAFVTNPLHELLLTEPTVTDGVFVAGDGPLLWIHLLGSFALVIGSLTILGIAFMNQTVHRTQTAIIIASIGIGFGAFIIESLVAIHPALNIGIFGIVIASGMLVWAITNAGLLRTVPVARKALMDNMDDYIIAVDLENNIIDVNETTADFLKYDGSMLGKSVETVFQNRPELIDPIIEGDHGNHEVAIEFQGRKRFYNLHITPITTTLGFRDQQESDLVGRLIVISDITHRRRREDELDLLKEVFGRILRHNMRNDLNVIKGNASILVEQVDESHKPVVETVERCTDDLLDMSEKARDLETIIESPRDREPVELTLAIKRAVSAVEAHFPDAEIAVDIEVDCWVLSHRELETAIRNLVENACEHDSSPPTTITITVSATDDTVTVTISDDGPGIPEHELDVIEAGSETTLQHGSGLGLWIINWVIERSKGRFEIERDDGTTARLILDRADPTGIEEDKPDGETERSRDENVQPSVE